MGNFAESGERQLASLGAQYAGGAVKKLPKGVSQTALAVTDRRLYYSRQQSETKAPEGKTSAAYSDTVVDLTDVSAVSYGYEPKRTGWLVGILLFLFLTATGAVLGVTLLKDQMIPVIVGGTALGVGACLLSHFLTAASAKKRRVMTITVTYTGGSLSASFTGLAPEKVTDFRAKLFVAKDALAGRSPRAGFSTAEAKPFSPKTPAESDVFIPSGQSKSGQAKPDGTVVKSGAAADQTAQTTPGEAKTA